MSKTFTRLHLAQGPRPGSFIDINNAPPPPSLPEPASLGLLGASLAGLAFARRRRPVDGRAEH